MISKDESFKKEGFDFIEFMNPEFNDDFDKLTIFNIKIYLNIISKKEKISEEKLKKYSE